MVEISKELSKVVEDHIVGLISNLKEGSMVGMDLKEFIQKSVNDLVEVKEVCEVTVEAGEDGTLEVAIAVKEDT